jgi:hypothetical protein
MDVYILGISIIVGCLCIAKAIKETKNENSRLNS